MILAYLLWAKASTLKIKHNSSASDERHKFTVSRHVFGLISLLQLLTGLLTGLTLHVQGWIGQSSDLQAVFWASTENSRDAVPAEGSASAGVWWTLPGSCDAARSNIGCLTWWIWMQFVGLWLSVTGNGRLKWRVSLMNITLILLMYGLF